MLMQFIEFITLLLQPLEGVVRADFGASAGIATAIAAAAAAAAQGGAAAAQSKKQQRQNAYKNLMNAKLAALSGYTGRAPAETADSGSGAAAAGIGGALQGAGTGITTATGLMKALSDAGLLKGQGVSMPTSDTPFTQAYNPSNVYSALYNSKGPQYNSMLGVGK